MGYAEQEAMVPNLLGRLERQEAEIAELKEKLKKYSEVDEILGYDKWLLIGSDSANGRFAHKHLKMMNLIDMIGLVEFMRIKFEQEVTAAVKQR